MQNFKIVTDSSCDLTLETLKRADVGFIPFCVSLDGQTYKKEKIELDINDFYHTLLTENVFPKTSLPPVQDYLDAFRGLIEDGHKKIICVCLSSLLSGSYQSAVNASRIVAEENPDCKVLVVDSLAATALQGIMVMELVKMRDDNVPFEEAYEKILSLRSSGKIGFTVDSLDYLQKGGRIGRLAAFAGEILNIKPVLKLEDGKLTPINKVRGKKKAILEIVDYILKEIGGNKEDFTFFALYGTDKEAAASARKILEEEHGYSFYDDFLQVGVTIGSHTGPTAIGVGFLKKYN